jgi:TRAP-type C4-dicarboxylate transport system substrate-binding protein
LSGVAGDELEQRDRLLRGQLDGVIGTLSCDRFSPSFRILRLPGIFADFDETTLVLDRLQPMLESEAHQHGLVLPATSSIGRDLFFTRVPVRTLAELRKLKLWYWDLDEVGLAVTRAMGLTMVPLPVQQAAAAFDRGEVDGFIAAPPAALAFQWFTRARYMIDLRPSFIAACLVLRESSFFRLPPAQQASLRASVAALAERNRDTSRRSEELLLGPLVKSRGLELLPISPALRAEFAAAADAASDKLSEQLVPKRLIQRAREWIAQSRAERQAARSGARH